MICASHRGRDTRDAAVQFTDAVNGAAGVGTSAAVRFSGPTLQTIRCHGFPRAPQSGQSNQVDSPNPSALLWRFLLVFDS
jgi:hypothetical protein